MGSHRRAEWESSACLAGMRNKTTQTGASMTDNQPEHVHDWAPATKSDTEGYFFMNKVAVAPSGFVRLEKCRACPRHRVIALDKETGQPVPHDIDYQS